MCLNAILLPTTTSAGVIIYSIASECLASRMGLSTGNRCRTDLRLFNKFTQGIRWF